MDKRLQLLMGNFERIRYMNIKDVETTIGNVLNLLYEVNEDSSIDCCIKSVIDVLHALLAALHISINSHPIGNYKERIIDEIATLGNVSKMCVEDKKRACMELAKKQEVARSLYEGLLHELRLMGISDRMI